MYEIDMYFERVKREHSFKYKVKTMLRKLFKI